MKKYAYLVCLLIYFSCSDAPTENYPIEPVISSIDISFAEGIDVGSADTLAVTITFTDGDGDVGLEFGAMDTLSPHHPWIFFRRETGEHVPSEMLYNGYTDINELIRLSDRNTPPYDTLPDPQETCYDDRILRIFDDPPHHIQNPDFHNIFVDFFYEDTNGQMVEYDWYKNFCVAFDGRFSARWGKEGPFVLDMENYNKGQLTYKMVSFGFDQLFDPAKKMKLKVYIKDRALHQSNVIETEEFVLEEI